MPLPPSVPPPTVTITGSPVDYDFFTGLQLNITCSIQILQYVDSLAIDVSAHWSKDGSILLTSGDHVTVGDDPVRVGHLLYQSTVVFSSLDESRDNGEYTCRGRINSSQPATAAFTITVPSM